MPIGDIAEALRQLEAARIADPLSLDVRRIQAHVFVEAGRYRTRSRIACGSSSTILRSPMWICGWPGLVSSGRFDEAEQSLSTPGRSLGVRGLPSRSQRPTGRSRGTGREISRRGSRTC